MNTSNGESHIPIRLDVRLGNVEKADISARRNVLLAQLACVAMQLLGLRPYEAQRLHVETGFRGGNDPNFRAWK
jgi:hypothetical protein